MTPINIIADGKIVGHVEETINVLMGCPSWEWTCKARPAKEHRAPPGN
jgi:hypothetical protein